MEKLEQAVAQRIILAGPFPGGVRVIEDDTRQAYPENYRDAVDKNWGRVLMENPSTFDGVVWGLVSAREEEAKQAGPSGDSSGSGEESCRAVVLTLRASQYRHLLASHFPPPDLDLSPNSARQHSINALGVSALTITADGAIILGKRRANSPAMPNYFHFLPAGNMDQSDPLAILAAELHEELGLQLDNPEHVTSAVCLGVSARSAS